MATVPWEYSCQVLVLGFLFLFQGVITWCFKFSPMTFTPGRSFSRSTSVNSVHYQVFSPFVFVIMFLNMVVGSLFSSKGRLLLLVSRYGCFWQFNFSVCLARVLAVATSYTVCHDNLLFLEGYFFSKPLFFTGSISGQRISSMKTMIHGPDSRNHISSCVIWHKRKPTKGMTCCISIPRTFALCLRSGE